MTPATPSWRRWAAALAGLLVSTGCDYTTVSPYAGRQVTTPMAIASGPGFTQLTAGFFHTCALTAAGNPYCWGSNQNSQVGTQALLPGCDLGTCSFVPVTAGDGRSYRQLTAGTTHSCGIAADSATFCWGGTTAATAPILGDGATIVSASGIRVRTDSVFVQITAGGAHTCGLTAGGTALCWGRNESGQLGDGTQLNRGTPVVVGGPRSFRALSAGADFTCGVTASRALYCWGSNQWGQLGVGEVSFNVAGRTVPAPALVAGSWTAVAAGGSHACALGADGRIACWGRNDNMAQLGDSSGVTHRGVPGPIRSTLTFASVSAGAGHSCARTAGGEAWCWGSNGFGQIGNGRVNGSGEAVPVKVQGGPWLQLALGGSHSCGIETGGGTKCWGDRYFGALGVR